VWNRTRREDVEKRREKTEKRKDEEEIKINRKLHFSLEEQCFKDSRQLGFRVGGAGWYHL
jgi:hypothetical protein